MVQHTQVGDKNEEAFANIMKFYLVNFVLNPPRDLFGRLGFFKHLNEAETLRA